MVICKDAKVILRSLARSISPQISDEARYIVIPLESGQEATESCTTVNPLNQCVFPGWMTPSGSTQSSPVGKNNLRQLQNYPHSFTFGDVVRLFVDCDVDAHFDVMRSTMLRYSFKIYGLPECPEEDLFLAVHFFLEDVFGVVSKLELCVRFVEGDATDVVGVVLDSIMTKHNILMEAGCLEGTGVRLRPNKELDWILDGFIFNRTLLKDLTKKSVGKSKARVSLKF